MGTPVKTHRPYRSQLRAEQARRTRERIIVAARERFVEDGYAGVSIASIAEAAECAAETVYDIFRSKRRLLEEVVSASIAGGFDEPDGYLETAWVADLKNLPQAADRIAGFADHTAGTLERMAPIHALVRAAAAGDPALADLPARIHDGRFERQRRVLEALTWDRPGLRLTDAADTFSALVSPELHHLLRNVRGWSAPRYANWLSTMAVVTVLNRADD